MDKTSFTFSTSSISRLNIREFKSTGDWQNRESVICVICVICGHFEKAGIKDPLITLIMDARDLRVARVCGKWARDETTGRA
jgi:hypothetical protein